MTETTHLGLPFIEGSQAQKHVTHNEALRMLDALVMLAAHDRDLTSPPLSPADGDRYIVKAPGTGGFAGKDNQIAVCDGGVWTFYPPQPGWCCYVADEAALLVYDGSVWQIATGTVLQNLALLGVGTTADATNPLAAKLNNALFAAKTVAEGGDGHLRYKLSKESAGKTLSFLFQDNYSGRAEIGLTGDDCFHFKMSPDGVTWSDALVLDGSSGTRINLPTTVQVDTGTALTIDLQEGNGVFQATRYANSSNAPVFFGRKARGTRASPAAVQAGDTLIGFRGYGYTGSQFVSGPAGAAFLLLAAENWVDSAAYGTQIQFFTTGNGTTPNTERLRIADSGDLQMGGANTVINASRHPVLRAYTVATLPAASPAGQLIYVSNGSSNRRLAVSDGSAWRFLDGDVVS